MVVDEFEELALERSGRSRVPIETCFNDSTETARTGTAALSQVVEERDEFRYGHSARGKGGVNAALQPARSDRSAQVE